MEQKKTPRADVSRMRTTGFLMGLVLVLALLYVALEWNAAVRSDDVEALDLSDIMHETELVPMSNVEVLAQLEDKKSGAEAEELNIVDDDVEVQQAEEPQGNDGDDDESLLRDLAEENDKALASLDVDPQNPLNFHVVEDLPQFPGGAVELMKWLTKNLRYPPKAQQQKVQGRVVAVFYVEKDGSITGLNIVRSLSAECDQEALRVLKMMPNWTPGIQHDKPCRTKVQIPIVFKL